MYSIRSHDGLVYGPADLSLIARWIGEGRILPDTILIDHLTNSEGLAFHFPMVAQYFPQSSPSGFSSPSSYGGSTSYSNPNHSSPPNFGMSSPAPNPYARNQAPFAYPSVPYVGQKQKVVAGLLALFLGTLGIHQFYLGKNGLGITMLLLTVLTCGWGGVITGIWAFIDAICIFTGATRDGNGQMLI